MTAMLLYHWARIHQSGALERADRIWCRCDQGMERLGIVVDLSHANETTVTGALKVAKNPVLVSHTGLNTQLGSDERMAKMFAPRLISKVQAKVVADNGGVIGVWTHLADTALEYAQNIKAMVNVAGIDHVCIGTDTKLTRSNDKPGGPRPGQGPRPDENRHKERLMAIDLKALLQEGKCKRLEAKARIRTGPNKQQDLFHSCGCAVEGWL